MMAVAKQQVGLSQNNNCIFANTMAATSSPVNSASNPTNNNSIQSIVNDNMNGDGSNCCASCSMPIRDRFIFSVIERTYHENCVRCFDCSTNLNDTCFAFEGKLYCRIDYYKRFGPKCTACQEAIRPTDWVQRLKENLVYHVDCFVCQDCKQRLQAGDQLHLIDDRKILCKRDFMNISSQQQIQANGNKTAGQDYHRIRQSHQQQVKQDADLLDNLGSTGSVGKAASCEHLNDDDLDELNDDQSSMGDNMERASSVGGDSLQFAGPNGGQSGFLGSGSNHQGLKSTTSGEPQSNDLSRTANCIIDCADDLVDANGKRRGPRTTIKPKQLDILRRAFETAPKPSRHIREQLAEDTGLGMRVIQVWFQNRRSKERRMKNSSGSARRNFFRSSSRRLRVGPPSNAAGNGATSGPAAGGGASSGANSNLAANQQSLMASGRATASDKGAAGIKQSRQQQQQQMSPKDGGDPQMLAFTNQQSSVSQRGQQQQHNSPSEFGGSSSGGFTYFSDSSNQGDAFAINGNNPQTSQSNQANAQYNGPRSPSSVGGTTLMTLESPASAGATNQQQQASTPVRAQYGNIKTTPPTQQMYSAHGPPQQLPPRHSPVTAGQMHHMMPPTNGPQQQPPPTQPPPPSSHAPSHMLQHQTMQPQLQQSPHVAGQMMQQAGPGMSMAFPHGASVVSQW